MSLDNTWFTEKYPDVGAAFSLRIKSKLHEEQSPFQLIEVYETEGFGNLMVIDGCVMLTSRDNFIYHEMMAHPVLFTHPNPKKVLIIGGGDCGTLREVLKHPGVESVQQVDIDECVTRVSERFFPELCESNDDPRARLYFEDGIEWVKAAEEGTYDVIIVDGTDPVGPGEILFTKEFFASCRRALGNNGLLVQQSESPLFHTNSIIKPMHQRIRNAGYQDVVCFHFPQCSYPSGWWTCTMARKDGMIDGFREKAAESKAFETLYYNKAIHIAATAMPEFFRKAL